MDASFGVSKDDWTAELYVVNLTDENKSVYSTQTQFILAEVPMRPRTIGLRFGYQFGALIDRSRYGPVGQPTGSFLLARSILHHSTMQSIASPATSVEPAGIDAELRELQRLIELRHFDDALAASERLLGQFPGQRDLLYMRAVALRHLQRVPEALATLELLEDLHPTYPRLFQERGHCHVFLRQAPEAIQAFSRAVEINPALPASWRMLASLYAMVGRRPEAEIAAQHVAKLATLAPEVVTARSMLADGNLRGSGRLDSPLRATRAGRCRGLARARDGRAPERVLEGRGDHIGRRDAESSRLPRRTPGPGDCVAGDTPARKGPGADRNSHAGPTGRVYASPHAREHPGQPGFDGRGHRAVPASCCASIPRTRNCTCASVTR